MSDQAYVLATTIYRQGMECDAAAGIIRSRLPEFLATVKKEVRERMGAKYKEEWER